MSIVLRLQKKCVDNNEDLQSLLREALLISTKLKQNDFKVWINNELKGYNEVENENYIPDYRKIATTLKFKNPYRGWIPAIIPDFLEDQLTHSYLKDSISELEELLTHKESSLIINLSPSFKNLLMESFNSDFEPAMFISSTNVKGIIDTVRTVLLEWTLKLEEDNILGSDDLTFTEEEKETAKNIHIENFYGVMGGVDSIGNLSTGSNTNNNLN